MWSADLHTYTGWSDAEMRQVRTDLETSLKVDLDRLQEGSEQGSKPEVAKLKGRWDLLKAANERKTDQIRCLKQELATQIERNAQVCEDTRLRTLQDAVDRKDTELQLLCVETDQLEHLAERTKTVAVGLI